MDTNNAKQTRNNNNSIVSVQNITPINVQRLTKEELLARDIAEALNDHQNISRYLHYAQIYPEDFLRQILSEVKQTPLHKIKKSRAALFNYLIHLRASENS